MLPDELLNWSLTSPFNPGKWAGELLESMGRGGTYKFLRVHEVDGQPRVLFRVVAENGSPNYHDYLPVVHPNGTMLQRRLYP